MEFGQMIIQNTHKTRHKDGGWVPHKSQVLGTKQS
jgi:hypothetical protein